MIREAVFYQLVCDRCQRTVQEINDSEYAAWADRDGCLAEVQDDGLWLIEGYDRHVCGACQVYDEERDEYVENPEPYVAEARQVRRG